MMLEVFENERPKLFSLAYRMLGERSAAEDTVQETWIRWSTSNHDEIQNPGAWLRKTASRLAIDILKSARSRRETYVGPWLPEAIVSEIDGSVEEVYEVAKECELALLWAMERLGPEERAAFILRTAFDAEYEEIARTLGKSEQACRKLVSRAKKHVKHEKPRITVSKEEKAELLMKFVQATAAADHETVLSMLAPDVVYVSDGGGKARAAFRELVGREEVARVSIAVAQNYKRVSGLKVSLANDSPALVVLEGSNRDVIYTIGIDDNHKIDWVYTLRNPDKLRNSKQN